ncbi:MAG: hypothetical protein QOH54_2063 [Mycobacterium sp.]|nr:hypothetical protein [Mycobacterium sp.]
MGQRHPTRRPRRARPRPIVVPARADDRLAAAGHRPVRAARHRPHHLRASRRHRRHRHRRGGRPQGPGLSAPHPDVTIVESIGTGNGHAPSRLAQLVRQLTLPDGRGYCWFAGEAAESRAVRKHFRGRGWTVEQLDITGYWPFDSETWDAKFALVENDVVAVWERALADGKGEKVADEEFDEALERAGL